jgi:hypothetical protein
LLRLLALSSIIPSIAAAPSSIKLKSRQNHAPKHPLHRRSAVSEPLTDWYSGTDLQVRDTQFPIPRTNTEIK